MCQARLPPTKSGELGGKAPNHKQISNLKFKIPNEDSSFEDFWFWILSIVWNLVFGAWNFPKPTLLVWWGEEGEDDARSAWPSDTLGNTRNTMATTTRPRRGNPELIVIKVAPVQIEVCNSTS